MDANGSHALYRFFSSSGDLLYVGITCNPARRFEKHGDTKDWWPEVVRIEMEHHPDRAGVLAAERAAVQAEKPKYNVRLQRSANVAALEPESAVEPATDPALGLWFHSVKNGEVGWQGQIIGLAGAEGYKVQLYDWLMGDPSNVKLVTHREIEGWRFYPSNKLMRIASIYHDVAFPMLRAVECPRCDAVGEVFRRNKKPGDVPEDELERRDRVVVWRGRPGPAPAFGNGRRDGVWADHAWDEEIADELYGCGYCGGAGT